MTDKTDRVREVGMDLIETIKQRLVALHVTHEEYRIGCEWLVELAASGEMGLFLDLHFESFVERSANSGKPGSEATVLGPFHTDRAAMLETPYRIPVPSNGGVPFVFGGHVTDLDGKPLHGATVDVWQADNNGLYSGFGAPGADTDLRGLMSTDDGGGFQFATVRPAPYQVPTGGPTGQFLAMTGRHAWRPAHFHFIIKMEGFETLVTQVYFADDEIIAGEGDVVDAVKDSLIVEVGNESDPDVSRTFDITSPYVTAEYSFSLRPID